MFAAERHVSKYESHIYPSSSHKWLSDAHTPHSPRWELGRRREQGEDREPGRRHLEVLEPPAQKHEAVITVSLIPSLSGLVSSHCERDWAGCRSSFLGRLGWMDPWDTRQRMLWVCMCFSNNSKETNKNTTSIIKMQKQIKSSSCVITKILISIRNQHFINVPTWAFLLQGKLDF